MNTKKLREIWKAPENARLTKQQFSFRLPIAVAAKLFALEELFPGRTRTQLISDLLSLALEDYEEQLPYRVSPYRSIEAGDKEDLWIMEGERAIFRRQANRNHKALHQQVKGFRDGTLYDEIYWTKDELPTEDPPQ